jgi:predicted ATPase/DNA-binding CsgD family transcriptional regulator
MEGKTAGKVVYNGGMGKKEVVGPFPAPQLTRREQEVLGLLAEGLSDPQIAERLTLATTTIKWYARQIYGRLGVDNRRDAVIRAGELGLLPAAEAPIAPPHNLPASATPFVGRERELARLDGLLADPGVRLITITGPGGIGKTRLALAAAAAQLSAQRATAGTNSFPYSDGVLFVSLATVATLEELIVTTAATLNLQFDGKSKQPLLDQLFNFLRLKDLLLILDNFEQLVSEAAILSTLLSKAAGVKLLVTSRERLGLQAEHLFPIDGLEVPPATNGYDSPFDGTGAVQLFLNTARRVQPRLELDEEDKTHLLRICRTVDGIPLAIELAASWTVALPLASIAHDIETSLATLAAEMRDLPPRHQSIQAVLDASWQRLIPEQQMAFSRLAVFRNGFTREAAYEVARASLAVLVQLVHKSWVVYDQAVDRYRMHQLLRQFGLQQLAAARLEVETREAHAAYFMTFLQDRTSDFYSPRQLLTVHEIQLPADDIWQAWQSTVSRQNPLGIEQGLDALCNFLSWVGRSHDALRACRNAATVLANLDSGKGSDAHLSLWVKVLLRQCEFTSSATERAQLTAQAQALIARAAAVGIDTRAGRAQLYLRLGNGAGDVRVNLRHLTRAVPLFRSLSDNVGLSTAKAAQAFALGRLGQLDRAVLLAKESLTIRKQMGDKLGTADGQRTLALFYKTLQQPEEAEALEREAIHVYRELQTPDHEAGATGNLANTLQILGRYEEGLQAANDASAINRGLGRNPDPYFERTKAQALLHLGRYPESRRMAEQALVVARSTGDLFTPSLLMNLGQVAATTGESDPESPWLQEGITSMKGLWPVQAAEFMAVRAYIALQVGERQQAHAYLDEALCWAGEHGSNRSWYYCLPAAALLIAPGNPERAVELHALSQTFAHIANSRWFYDMAGKELEAVSAQLPAEAVTARERGRMLELRPTAVALHEELSGRSAQSREVNGGF